MPATVSKVCMDDLIRFTVRQYPHRDYLLLEYYLGIKPQQQPKLANVFKASKEALDHTKRFIYHQDMENRFSTWFNAHGILSRDYIFDVTSDYLDMLSWVILSDARTWSTKKSKAIEALFEYVPPFDINSSNEEVASTIQSKISRAFAESHKTGYKAVREIFTKPEGDDVLMIGLRNYFTNSYNNDKNFYHRVKTFIDSYEFVTDKQIMKNYLAQQKQLRYLKLGIYTSYIPKLAFATQIKVTRNALFASGAYAKLTPQSSAEVDLILFFSGFNCDGQPSISSFQSQIYDSDVTVSTIPKRLLQYFSQMVGNHSLGPIWQTKWPHSEFLVIPKQNWQSIKAIVRTQGYDLNPAFSRRDMPTYRRQIPTRGETYAYSPMSQSPRSQSTYSFGSVTGLDPVEKDSSFQMLVIVGIILGGFLLTQ